MSMNADLAQSPQGHFAAVNGIEMYYEVHGQGTPLLILHGTPSSGRSWQATVPVFAKHFRVILPDFRGYGRSTNPQNDWTHRQLAYDVCALLDHLGIDECQAMGVSSGALVLLHMATQQPSRLSAMILIGATPYVTAGSRALVRQWALDSPNWDWEAMRQEHMSDERIHAIIEGLYDYADRHDDINFTPPYLATITAKTLLIHGDRDEHFPVQLAVEIYKAIPDAYLWVVPNAGHVPIRNERAALFDQIALEFLQGSWDQT
jgi:pimeloyl-ACP methyl ester carboxylesterase